MKGLMFNCRFPPCLKQNEARGASLLSTMTYLALHDGAWLYGVHRTCAETAAISRGTSHATTKQR